jgi:hypothetical protein
LIYERIGETNMSGSRAKAMRRGHKHAGRDYVLESEYPALSPQELAEPATERLRKSRKAFMHAGSDFKPLTYGNDFDLSLGAQTKAPHSSASKVDEWLQGWRMPANQDRSELRTSLTTYVGFVESREMPSASSRLKGKTPYVLITSRFVDLCWKLTEVFPVFVNQAAFSNDVHVGQRLRNLLFTHLGLSDEDREENAEVIEYGRDALLSERVTSAAIRWAIAHEMAHIHGSEPDRTDAYLRAERSYPDVARDQWEPKRNELSNFAESITSYKQEIACDLLANQYVLDSPFAADDIITQAIGSLIALQALIWDGHRLDGAKVSDSHPSPSLRLQLVAKDWEQLLSNPETWSRCKAPGKLAMADFAHMIAFDRWARGAYGEHREGPVWSRDIKAEFSKLERVVPQGGVDSVFVQRPEGLHRIRPSAQ